MEFPSHLCIFTWFSIGWPVEMPDMCLGLYQFLLSLRDTGPNYRFMDVLFAGHVWDWNGTGMKGRYWYKQIQVFPAIDETWLAIHHSPRNQANP